MPIGSTRRVERYRTGTQKESDHRQGSGDDSQGDSKLSRLADSGSGANGIGRGLPCALQLGQLALIDRRGVRANLGSGLERLYPLGSLGSLGSRRRGENGFRTGQGLELRG